MDVDQTYSKFSQLIEEKRWKSVKDELQQYDPIEIAEIMAEADEKESVMMFRLLNQQQSKEVFHQLSREDKHHIVESLALNKHKISELLNNLEPDDRTALFEELPGEVVQMLMQYLTPEERDISIQLMGYPEESIGRLMTTEYVAVKSHFTVEQAFNHIRRFGRDSETLNVVYVVDDGWKLIDDLRIKELILADPGKKIADLIDHKFVALNVLDDQEEAIKTFSDYDRVALPVVDTKGILIGIVSFDDIMDVAEEESTEDFHKFGSFKEAITDPLTSRLSTLYKSRIVWLILLVFINIFSGAVLATFEDVIQQVVALVFFLPLLIDSGGNAGSQSATLMIRALATGDVELSDWYKLIGKEILVSVTLGATMAAGAAAIAFFRSPEIIVVISITMLLIVVVGSLIGMLLPFIFTKFKIDPATASAPLITSIADIVGVLIYFSIASWYLG